MERQPAPPDEVIVEYMLDGKKYELRHTDLNLTQEQTYEYLKQYLPDIEILPAYEAPDGA